MTNNLKYPLKLILFGEHSVLRNGKGIVLAINKFGKSQIKQNAKGILIIDKDKNIVDLSYFINNDELLEIYLDCRIGCGLGSSAAVSLILADYFIKNKNLLNNNYKYLFNIKNKIVELGNNDYNKSDTLLDVALEIENIFHGKSSGIDVTASYISGLLCYQNYKYYKMNSNYLLKYKILIYDSKIQKCTKNTVNNAQNKTGIYEKIMEISEKAEKLLQSHFYLADIYTLIRQNQELLEELGIVPEEMKNEIRKLRSVGIESKITGAGNGGHLFTVVDKNMKIDGWEEVTIYIK